MSRIQQHYKSEAIMQLAKLFLSFDAIGNPAGLVMNIGEGVKDLFYEPYDALVHDPLNFVHATVKGTRSFATKVA
jgi:Vacuolar-sorting-associated 13 protein C-terminal